MSKLFEQVDVIVTSTKGDELVLTNLTGHPACIVPNGLRGADAPAPPAVDTGDEDQIGGPGMPVSLTFLAGPIRTQSSVPSLAHTSGPQVSRSFTQRCPAKAKEGAFVPLATHPESPPPTMGSSLGGPNYGLEDQQKGEIVLDFSYIYDIA
jgi:hypothetical protein